MMDSRNRSVGRRLPGSVLPLAKTGWCWRCRSRQPAVQRKPDVYIAPLGNGMDREAARLARELRRHDVVVELGDETFRLKKSLETASKIGARFALIVGENEVKSGSFALKNLETGEQVSVPRAELARKISITRVAWRTKMAKSDYEKRLLVHFHCCIWCFSVAALRPSFGRRPSLCQPLEQTLITNTKAIPEAQKTKDVALLKRMLTDDFVAVGSEGHLHDKEEILGSAHDGELKDYYAYNLRVVPVNDEAAIVTYDCVIHMPEGDAPGMAPRYQHISDLVGEAG